MIIYHTPVDYRARKDWCIFFITFTVVLMGITAQKFKNNVELTFFEKSTTG